MAKKQKQEVEESMTATLATGSVVTGPKSVVERVVARTRAASPVGKPAAAKKAPAKKAAAKKSAAPE